MSSTAPEVIASFIAAATALVAVVVGPFITIRATKTQMLGPMRQAWINSLRDTVAEYTANINLGIPQSGALLSRADEIRLAAQDAIAEHEQQTYQLKSKITLLINPKEVEHQELIHLVEAAYSAYVKRQDPAIPLQALVAQTQVVLKKEWNVVKS